MSEAAILKFKMVKRLFVNLLRAKSGDSAISVDPLSGTALTAPVCMSVWT